MAISARKYRNKIVESPIIKTLIWLSLPLIAVQLIQVSYNIVDAFWLSMYSDIALAIPREVWPLFLFFSAFSTALSSSNIALISQYVGAKSLNRASEAASKFFTASLAIGIFFGAIFFALRPLIFTYVIKVPAEIYDQVLIYAGIIALTIPFSYMVTAYSTILQSIGDTKRPALVTAFYLIVNSILDPLCIFGIGPFPRLGVIGAAITDLIGNALSTATLALIVKKMLSDLRVTLTKNIDLEWIILNLKVGLPILVLVLSNSVAKMLQLRLVNTFGIITATVYSLGFVAIDLSNAALRGFSRAAAIMVGQNLGAKLRQRARKIALDAAMLVFIVTLAGAFILYILRDTFIHIFIQNPMIYFEAKRFLEIFLWSLPFLGILLTAISIGKGSGHTLPPTLIGIARLWGFWVGLGYLLALLAGYGSMGIWIAMTVGNIASGLIALVWLKYGKWTYAIVHGRKAYVNSSKKKKNS